MKIARKIGISRHMFGQKADRKLGAVFVWNWSKALRNYKEDGQCP